MNIFKIMIIIFLMSVIFLSSIALGLCLFPFAGEYFGGSIAILFFIMTLLLGDKFILFLMTARLFKGSSLNNINQNLTCRLGISKVGLYFSSKYKNNIYCVETFNHNASIIIGEELLTKLNHKELECIIYYYLLLINSGAVRYISMINFLFLILEFPLILKKYSNIPLILVIAKIISFYLYPLRLIKNLLLGKLFEQSIYTDDINLDNEKKMQIKSVIFKIRNNKIYTENSFWNDFLISLSLGCNRKIGLLDQMVEFTLKPSEKKY